MWGMKVRGLSLAGALPLSAETRVPGSKAEDRSVNTAPGQLSSLTPFTAVALSPVPTASSLGEPPSLERALPPPGIPSSPAIRARRVEVTRSSRSRSPGAFLAPLALVQTPVHNLGGKSELDRAPSIVPAVWLMEVGCTHFVACRPDESTKSEINSKSKVKSQDRRASWDPEIGTDVRRPALRAGSSNRPRVCLRLDSAEPVKCPLAFKRGKI